MTRYRSHKRIPNNIRLALQDAMSGRLQAHGTFHVPEKWINRFRTLIIQIHIQATERIKDQVTNKKQIARIGNLSGTILPERFRAIVDRFGDNPKAMQQAGIAYATDQIIDLIANGIQNIHVYSMNKPQVAIAIMNNLSEIVK